MTTKQVNSRVNGAAAFERVMHGATSIDRVVQRIGRQEVEVTTSDGTVLVLVVKDVICPAPTKVSSEGERP